jgi:SdrD B-like domain
VFTSEGCVAGKVFVDCNNNHIQDKGEPGIPGVRLYMEDSTYFVTDSEGKYSYCGLTPTSHIIKVDPASLPLRARLTTSSNRNLGDAGSLLIDLRSGEFARGDFVEGSCTPSLLQEVQNRVVKDGGAQLVLPKGEGTPDVHKTLDGLVLPRPIDPKPLSVPLPGLKGVMAPVGAPK